MLNQLVLTCCRRSYRNLRQLAAHVSPQRQRGEVVGAGPPDRGLLLAHDGHLRDQIGPLLERPVDDPLDRVLERGRQGQRGEIDDLERGRGQDAHALGERHLRVALLGGDVLQVELRLHGLLPGEQDFGDGFEPLLEARLCGPLHRPGRVERALGHGDPGPDARQSVEGPLHAERQILVTRG